jgi:hypothetical protein
VRRRQPRPSHGATWWGGSPTLARRPKTRVHSGFEKPSTATPLFQVSPRPEAQRAAYRKEMYESSRRAPLLPRNRIKNKAA